MPSRGIGRCSSRRRRSGTRGPPRSGCGAGRTGRDAEPGYGALFESQEDFGNEVAAGMGLRVGTSRPIRWASRVRCPWLVCVAARDVIPPPGAALAAASRAPHAEVRRYDALHFDIYVGATFERVVADQVDFLSRHLLGAGTAKPNPAAASEAAR